MLAAGEGGLSGATTVNVFAATDISTPLVWTSGLVAFDLTREVIIYVSLVDEGEKKTKYNNEGEQEM